MKSMRIFVLGMMAVTGLALAACSNSEVEGGETGESTAELSEAPEMSPGMRSEGPRFGKHFELADKDNDGKVTEGEARAAAKEMFGQLDKNRDGRLEGEEMPSRQFGRGGKGGPQMFERFDKDGDGKVSKAEAPPMMSERFDAVDTDKDGFVTSAEARAMHEKRGGFMGSRMDTDGDGKVSAVEFEEGHVAMLRGADKDGDGAVTMDEMKSSPRGMGGPGGKHGRGGRHGEKAGKRFEELDADKDGKVTKAEAEAGRKARFAQIDTDGNGVLESAELAVHQDAMRGERGGKGGGAKQPRILRMDADNDGKVTMAEFEQKHASWFTEVDADSDGVVTQDEFRAKGGGKGRGGWR